MLGSPAGGGGGPAQRGGLWPLAPAPPTANFTTDGFSKYGIYSLPLLHGSPAFGSALYSHSSIGRFTAGSIQQPQPPAHTAFHAQHKDSIYTSTGYTFGAPTPPPGSPYSPGSVTQLELFAKGGFNSNIIIQQQQQIQPLPEYTVNSKKQCDEKCCIADKPQKPCACQQQQKTKFMLDSPSSGCSRTNPVDWSGSVNVKKEPGLGVMNMHPCQVAEVTTSECDGAVVKVEIGSPTQQVKNMSSDVIMGQSILPGLSPVVTSSGNIPVGIAVARQRIQHHDVVSSPSLPPSNLLGNTQIKEVARISEIDAGGMAATAAATGGVTTGGGALLQCTADENRGGFTNCWPMGSAQQHTGSAMATPTLWQYPAHLPMEPLVPMSMPLPPVGLQLVRDHNTGGLLLLPTTGVEQLQQTVVWPSYHQSPSHVLIPPLPPPPLQLLSSASSDYLQSSTTLHQHTQSHSTRLLVTTDNKRKLHIPTTLIKIETDAKTLQAVSSVNNNTGTVFTDPNMTPLVTTHVIYQHPTNLILSSQTQAETTLCKEQATSPVACLTPPPEVGSLQEEETFVQDASNQTDTFVEEERESEAVEEEKIEDPPTSSPPPPPSSPTPPPSSPTPPPSTPPAQGPDLSGLELLSNSIVEFEENKKKLDSSDKNKTLEMGEITLNHIKDKTYNESNDKGNIRENSNTEDRLYKNSHSVSKRLDFEDTDLAKINKENESHEVNSNSEDTIYKKKDFQDPNSNKLDSHNNRVSNTFIKLNTENADFKKFEAIHNERASDHMYKKIRDEILHLKKQDYFNTRSNSDPERVFGKNLNSEHSNNQNGHALLPKSNKWLFKTHNNSNFKDECSQEFSNSSEQEVLNETYNKPDSCIKSKIENTNSQESLQTNNTMFDSQITSSMNFDSESSNSGCNYKNLIREKTNTERNYRNLDFQKNVNMKIDAIDIKQKNADFEFERQTVLQTDESRKNNSKKSEEKGPLINFDSPKNIFKKAIFEFGSPELKNCHKSENNNNFEVNLMKSTDLGNGLKSQLRILKSEHNEYNKERNNFELPSLSKKLDLKIERRSVDYSHDFEETNKEESDYADVNASKNHDSEFGSPIKFKKFTSEYGSFHKLSSAFRNYKKSESKIPVKLDLDIDYDSLKKFDSAKNEIRVLKKLDPETEVGNFKTSEYSRILEGPVKSSEEVLNGIARMSLSDKETLPTLPLGEDLGGLSLLCALAEQRILEEEKEENIAEKVRRENAEKKLKRKHEEEDEIRRWKKEKRREKKKEKKRIEVEEENRKIQFSKELEERLNASDGSSGDDWKKKKLKEEEWRRERKKEKRKLHKRSEEPKKKKAKRSYRSDEIEDNMVKCEIKLTEHCKNCETYEVTPKNLKEFEVNYINLPKSEIVSCKHQILCEDNTAVCYNVDCLNEHVCNSNDDVERISSDCKCKEELFKTYKTKESEEEVRKFLASKSQPLCCKGDWPCMNAMELDMRMRLADLQRKYREKQKELSRLKPKRHEKKPKIRQRKKSDRSPPPPLLDKMDTPIPKKSGKLQDMLMPPTLSRFEDTVKTQKENFKSKRSHSLQESIKRSNNVQEDTKRPHISFQDDTTKLVKRNSIHEEAMKPHVREITKPTKRSNSLDEEEFLKKNTKVSEEPAIYASVHDVNDNQPNNFEDNQKPSKSSKSSKKRKVGRPKKMLSSSGLQTVTETIVAKKPKKGLVGYLLAAKEKLVQNGTANPNLDPPRFIEEPVTCKKKTKIGPKLKAEATVKTDNEDDDEGKEDVNMEVKVKKDMRCVLTTERLEEDRLRVLTAMGGLFYAGRLNAVEPPDVYSITLDGERGNRPHIMSREEILRDAIVEVSPASRDELTPGTRLCAYWSQQYRCLYPGSVAEPDSPEDYKNLDSKFISVEFDDGDNGRIAIEDIRLLPSDYPIIEYDPNPLQSLSKRRRRASTTEERRKSPTPVVIEPTPIATPPPPLEIVEEKDPLPFDIRQKKEDAHRERKRLKKRKREKLLKKKKKHRCLEENCKHRKHHKKHHRKHKKHHHQEKIEEKKEMNPVSVAEEVEEDASVVEEDISTLEEDEASLEEFPEYHIVPNPEDEVTMDDILEATKDKNSNKKIRDRQESCESRSKMSAFLPARQLWGWSGKGYKRPKAKGRSRKQFYRAIQRGKESILVGDSAVFLSTGRPDRPYIGRIEAMWESCGTSVVKVKWFYHPEETIGCPLNLKYPGALFESPHVDENDVQTISHKCEVLPLKDYTEKLGDDPQRYETIYDNNDIYYLAGHYDPTSLTLKMEPDIPSTD